MPLSDSSTLIPDPAPAAPELPAERFWQRYSRNGEPLLSGLSSFIVHALILGGILFGLLRWFAPPPRAVDIDLVFGDGIPVGGGGNPRGVGHGPQLNGRPDVQENLDQPKEIIAAPTDGKDDPKVTRNAGPRLADDPDVTNLVQRLKEKQPATAAGVYVKNALAGLTGGGRGGDGSKGGKGNVRGPGDGDAPKGGKGPLSPRADRIRRWTVNFNTSSGADYLRQLHLLGAILGVPDTKGNLMIIRDLTERPARSAYEDVKAINRIFWVDDRPESARSVAEALQLDIVPSQVVAFFPQSVEKQLLDAELAYGRPHGRTTEKDIGETVFNVTFRAGRPVFTVVSQRGR
jgi:hypothetical protein